MTRDTSCGAGGGCVTTRRDQAEIPSGTINSTRSGVLPDVATRAGVMAVVAAMARAATTRAADDGLRARSRRRCCGPVASRGLVGADRAVQPCSFSLDSGRRRTNRQAAGPNHGTSGPAAPGYRVNARSLWRSGDPSPRLTVVRLEGFHRRVDVGVHRTDGHVGRDHIGPCSRQGAVGEPRAHGVLRRYIVDPDPEYRCRARGVYRPGEMSEPTRKKPSPGIGSIGSAPAGAANAIAAAHATSPTAD